MPSTISAGTTAGTAIAIAGDTTGNLAFQTNGTTTAMTVTTAQNVGIKITTPGTDLQVDDATSMGTGSATADILSVTNNNAVLSGVAGDKLGIVMSGMSNLSDRRVGLYCTAGNANFNNPDFTIFQTGQGIAYRETLRVTADSSATLRFNSGYGSVAAAYGCRAWVNFDGSTSPGTIRGSGNVSSVSRTGTGAYTVNFTTSMPDANYSVVGIANADSRTVSIGNLLAGSAAMRTTNSAGALENQTLVAIAVFR